MISKHKDAGAMSTLTYFRTQFRSYLVTTEVFRLRMELSQKYKCMDEGRLIILLDQYWNAGLNSGMDWTWRWLPYQVLQSHHLFGCLIALDFKPDFIFVRKTQLQLSRGQTSCAYHYIHNVSQNSMHWLKLLDLSYSQSTCEYLRQPEKLSSNEFKCAYFGRSALIVTIMLGLMYGLLG